ncbi:DUF3077 domain-containing protein [Pseudomonas sp. R5(2019)]|uniref:DUF3077 domain-containing protein n=1 Tax=Pseudomonas sp. R5(2019) TaxID=2697566 RepID=UPI0014124785|nr:DUF3077 domain-containing protein [Pseudomonas sp. R5(2019)]NBA98343.1 DUF3077 domain-containing protein [Pseudomonas sp. R5(2019)]
MMKVVPDPPKPACSIQQTAQVTFGSCSNAHEPLFNVQPGVPAEEALRHLSNHLQAALEAANHVYTHTPLADTGMHWSTLWALEAAKALVEGLRIGAKNGVIRSAAECNEFIPGTLGKTAETPFVFCGVGNSSLFSVRNNVMAEDALVHVSLYLQSAYDTANSMCMRTPNADKGMHWATLHGIEVGRALTEALLEASDVV